MSTLSTKKCLPCEGIGEPLSNEKAKGLLSEILDWDIREDGKLILRDYVMKSFMAAIRFIHKVAEIAESENHHPDIHLTSYRKLRIELTTHALGGLSENDFIVAAKINNLTPELKA